MMLSPLNGTKDIIIILQRQPNGMHVEQRKDGYPRIIKQIKKKRILIFLQSIQSIARNDARCSGSYGYA